MKRIRNLKAEGSGNLKNTLNEINLLLTQTNHLLLFLFIIWFNKYQLTNKQLNNMQLKVKYSKCITFNLNTYKNKRKKKIWTVLLLIFSTILHHQIFNHGPDDQIYHRGRSTRKEKTWTKTDILDLTMKEVNRGRRKRKLDLLDLTIFKGKEKLTRSKESN